VNKWFTALSIKTKLLTIAVTSALFSMLLALVILVTINAADVKRKAQDDLQAVASLIANRSVAAVMFDDAGVAKENLISLNSFPDLRSACVYVKKGHLFTSLDNQALPCPDVAYGLHTHYDNLMLYVYQAMVVDSEEIGAVYLASDLSAAIWRELKFVSLIIAVLFVALFITFLLTVPLLNRVALPVAQLAKTAQRVSQDHDYSLRAEKHSSDEMGILVDAFNDMLDTVETQNKALIAVKNNYQALYDNNPTMVFNLDMQGRIVSVNRFGAKQLGLGVEELQGCAISNFSHPDDAAGFEQFFETCRHHPELIHRQESRKICRNGNVIWVRETARLVTDESNFQRLLLVCEDITETRRLSEKIAYQASHDELTGLVNRRQFDIHIQSLVSQAEIDESEHVLCYLDLDQFKIVNDTCGHLAGDELLRQLGEVLRHQVRKTDILARLGGDEFGILMSHCSVEQAFSTCEKLRNIICDFQFAWENRSFNIGVSVGIAPINLTSGNAVDILKEADAACYAAKEKGRNRVHVFSPDDEELTLRQGEMQWVEKIRMGIEQNRFQLYGQLIVPIASNDEGLHFETLIRYIDEQGKVIPPGAFLPAAERYNIAPPLDRWVISRLFEHLATTPNLLERLEMCSVNLSGLSMSDETMLTFIDEQFQKWHIPTHKICFEITETAAISNLSYARQFINSLRTKGCLFSLDDFGSGLSSFAYLKNLPVDFLKIDGLFVKDILEDRVDLTMVKSINEVAHVMSKKTIAEFVENRDIFELLKTLGVNYAQGYGIAKPVPLEEL